LDKKTNEIAKFNNFDGKNELYNFGRNLETWTKFWSKLVILDRQKITFLRCFLCPWTCFLHHSADIKSTNFSMKQVDCKAGVRRSIMLANFCGRGLVSW